MLAWKRQKIRPPKGGRIGTCTYDDVSKPLPPPPDGQIWTKDEMNQWRLVPCATGEPAQAEVVSIHEGDAQINGGESEGVRVASAKSHNNSVLYHEVRPTDTFQGICLRYKVTPTELRRANRLLSNNLSLVEKLAIPLNQRDERAAITQIPTREEIVADLVTRVSASATLTHTEARAYLELNDWNMDAAVENIREDFAGGPLRSASNADVDAEAERMTSFEISKG